MRPEHKRLTTEIPAKLHRLAKLRAYEEGKTLTDKIIELLKIWLGGEKNV